MAPFLTPLFPLPDLVLFPGLVLPLYVFEQRYRDLLADVRRSGEPFGIVRILEAADDAPGQCRSGFPGVSIGRARVRARSGLDSVGRFGESLGVAVVGWTVVISKTTCRRSPWRS